MEDSLAVGVRQGPCSPVRPHEPRCAKGLPVSLRLESADWPGRWIEVSESRELGREPPAETVLAGLHQGTDAHRRRGRRNRPDMSDWATSAADRSLEAFAGISPVSLPGCRRLLGPPQPPQFGQNFVQTEALNILHNIIMQAVLLADAIDRHDIGMVQPGGCFRLVLEVRCRWRGSSSACRGRTFRATCRPRETCTAS